MCQHIYCQTQHETVFKKALVYGSKISVYNTSQKMVGQGVEAAIYIHGSE
jgi:hypothetical protein